MLRVEKASTDNFEEVYPLLEGFENPNIVKSDYRLIFDCKWKSDLNFPGYVLRDDTKVVGYLGAIFSKRMINGQEKKFCNLTNWIVLEEYKNKSLLLLYQVLKLKDHTITNLTLNKKLEPLFRKLEFKPLETEIVVLLPVPWVAHRGADPLDLTWESNIIESTLSERDSVIYNDHKNYDCYHLLVQDGEEYCYIVFNIASKIRARVIKYKFNRILYISNEALFARHALQVNWEIVKKSRVWFTSIDSRFCAANQLPFSVKWKLNPDRLYKSSSLEPRQVYNLYTELVLLKI